MSQIAEKTIALFEEHHFNTYRRFPLTIISGQGSKVYDHQGKAYIDALGGIAVNSVGHCHPRVVGAIQEQAGQLMHVSNLYYTVPQSTLTRLLANLSGLDKAFLCNSGLEAAEGALKLARKHASANDRHGPVVSFTNCFHGRSIATLALGQEKYQQGFGPMPAGFLHLPYNDVEALDQVPDNAQAVFVECIQGEGGVVPASAEFMQKIQTLCRDKGILLVTDEIQTGIGRTGNMFSFQHFGLKPDIVTLAKGLGGGFPIGAVLAKKEVAQVLKAGDHGSTFGGNPLACAAALATLSIVVEENLTKAAQEKGEYFMKKLCESLAEEETVEAIRGRGLMIGVAFNFACRALAERMLQKGVLVSCTANQVIRFVPPLNIGYGDIDVCVRTLVQALQEVKDEPS
jgi:acetylornithine/N-succinyldiaminopimelate aminotransferase